MDKRKLVRPHRPADTVEASDMMPPRDRFETKTAWEDACWQALWSSRSLLDALMTGHERHDIILRAVALDRIRSGRSYRQIGDELGVSPQTVSGLVKVLKGRGYASYLERSKNGGRNAKPGA